MDWDGIGTFAMFISTGAIGVGIVLLRAYKAKLASKLEFARLQRSAEVPEDAQEQIRELEDQVRRLSDRVDFTEKLISGSGTTPPREEA